MKQSNISPQKPTKKIKPKSEFCFYFFDEIVNHLECKNSGKENNPFFLNLKNNTKTRVGLVNTTACFQPR